jgi:hypothetical protein
VLSSHARRAASAVLLLVSATGCDIGPPDAEVVSFDHRQVQAPPPAGPVVALGGGRAAGGTWRVAAYRARNDEVCLVEISAGSGGGAGCGPAPAPDRVVGPLVVAPRAGGAVLVHGVLAPAARRATVEVLGGPVEVELVNLRAAGLELHGFAVLLPAGEAPSAIVATDASGRVLERFELLEPDPVPGGPLPTPADD